MNRERARSIVLIIAGAVLVVGCATSVRTSTAPRSGHGSSSSTMPGPTMWTITSTSETSTTTTTAPPTTTPPIDPRSVINTVGLQPSDFPGATTETQPGHPIVRSTDPCKPIASSPFIAGSLSASYGFAQLNFTTIVYSEIAVYNSEAQAQAVAGTMGSAQWMQTCDEPSNLATAQSDATQTDGNMPCNLTIVNHNEAALATTGLPGGTGGWLFDSTVHCGVNNQDWSANTATIVTHRGRVVIALFAKAVENPQPPGQATPFNIDGPVAGAMTAVVGRAEAAQR